MCDHDFVRACCRVRVALLLVALLSFAESTLTDSAPLAAAQSSPAQEGEVWVPFPDAMPKEPGQDPRFL
jgi:hypothetical protein